MRDRIVGNGRDLFRIGLSVRQRRVIAGDVDDLADHEAGFEIHRDEFVGASTCADFAV